MSIGSGVLAVLIKWIREHSFLLSLYAGAFVLHLHFHQVFQSQSSVSVTCGFEANFLLFTMHGALFKFTKLVAELTGTIFTANVIKAFVHWCWLESLLIFQSRVQVGRLFIVISNVGFKKLPTSSLELVLSYNPGLLIPLKFVFNIISAI